MVSSRTLRIITVLITVPFIQAMDQSPAASASSSSQSGYLAIGQGELSAAKKNAQEQQQKIAAPNNQQIYNTALFQFYVEHPPKKNAAQMAYFNSLCRDIDNALRGASMRADTHDYMHKLQNLRTQAEKHIEHLKLATQNAAPIGSSKAKLGQLLSVPGSKSKPSLPAMPPAQQMPQVALPVVVNASPA